MSKDCNVFLASIIRPSGNIKGGRDNRVAVSFVPLVAGLAMDGGLLPDLRLVDVKTDVESFAMTTTTRPDCGAVSNECNVFLASISLPSGNKTAV